MVLPDWGMTFDIRPDEEAESVAARQKRREQARQATLRASSVLGQFDDTGDSGIAGDLLHSLQAGLSRSWMEPNPESPDIHRSEIRIASALPASAPAPRLLRAAEVVLERVAREFRGVDPLDPASRGHIAVVKELLTTLHKQLAERDHPVELEEPTGELVERLEVLSRTIE